MKTFIIAVALAFSSTHALAAESTQPQRSATYLGGNLVSICLERTSGSPVCKQIPFLPSLVGQVDHVVYNPFPYEAPGIFLAFVGATPKVCKVGNDDTFKCIQIVDPSTADVSIGVSTTDGKSEIKYSLRTSDRAAVEAVQTSFKEGVRAAYKKLLTRPFHAASKAGACKTDCPATPQIADEDMQQVFIYAPFPDNVFAGTIEIVEIAYMEGEPPRNVPEPMPDGVAPSDYLKARDPVGMAACTAGYFRAYTIMFQGCLEMRSPTGMRVCMERSFNAYTKNLMDECYAKYFY